MDEKNIPLEKITEYILFIKPLAQPDDQCRLRPILYNIVPQTSSQQPQPNQQPSSGPLLTK